MSATSEPRLPFDDAPSIDARSATAHTTTVLRPDRPIDDDDARRTAVDPTRNIVLEASAGTGKTRVLVERYVNLLRAGVEPDHILAMTFTRKAAAEMRERIIQRLREASRQSEFDKARWRELKDRLGDISISTIDAFCLSLLREFPLEADIDPTFDLADDTEVPRLIDEALDQALRICRNVARDDDDVALVFAQLGERRLRAGLGNLLDRRLVAPQALRRYLLRGPSDLTLASASMTAADRLRQVVVGVRDGHEAFLADGPLRHPQFAMLAADIRELGAGIKGLESREGQAAFRALVDRLRGYFLTQDGRPREGNFTGTGFKASHCDTDDAWRRHRQSAGALAPAIADAIRAFRRDLNVMASRGVWRVFAVTLAQYQRTLRSRALLDFPGVLEHAVKLLRNLDEFAQSRFRLEARYQHLLVDEFQDTSRAQWELVAQLARAWGEGLGAASTNLAPSIFIVGDRKQSIYGFRDADVLLMDEATTFVAGLRPEADAARSIAVSFRAVPALLAFVNDLFDAVDKAGERADAFQYRDSDRFPHAAGEPTGSPGDCLGLVVGETVGEAAGRVADEIVRLLGGAIVRDRGTGVRRPAVAADIAILFRSRDSHREFEHALQSRGVPTYVYKGLGFFEADEVQDVVALLKYLADPQSDLRAAAFLRSRFVRLSDVALASLKPAIAASLLASEMPGHAGVWGDDDRQGFAMIRRAISRWLTWVDRLPPSELIRTVLAETAYTYETRGIGRRQARENLKKLRGMIRRFQNRGYATLARVADHLDQLAVGDESNAALDAVEAVSLMTVHAAKGLEFPIVFVVNIGRGTGGIRAPIRVGADARGQAAVSVADYQSEADEDASAREREETKRLLYVAATRARDRLYWSTTVQNGVCRTGRGSLGEVLPPTFKALFSEAIPGSHGRLLAWTGRDGAQHPIRVPPAEAAPLQMPVRPGGRPVLDDFAPLLDP